LTIEIKELAQGYINKAIREKKEYFSTFRCRILAKQGLPLRGHRDDKANFATEDFT
jgi:hypothetical protein